MDLKKITSLFIVGFIASFFMRTIGTLVTIVFQNAYVVKVILVVNIFFMVAQFLFYVYFLREYAANRQQILKTGTVLAIIGSFFEGGRPSITK